MLSLTLAREASILVMGMEVFVVFAISAIICCTVGAFIDGQRGALWGFFLGPIGWIISAILKKPEIARFASGFNEQPSPISGSVSQNNNTTAAAPAFGVTESEQSVNMRKWTVLKEVDAEVRAASVKVSEFDPALDAILAEKYFILNQKEYLQRLTDSLIAAHAEQKAQEMARVEQLGASIVQMGQRQKAGYEMSLGADQFDHDLGCRVQSVDIYAGSWVFLRGGIRITLEDGRRILRNKGMRRDFAAGDESWV